MTWVRPRSGAEEPANRMTPAPSPCNSACTSRRCRSGRARSVRALPSRNNPRRSTCLCQNCWASRDSMRCRRSTTRISPSRREPEVAPPVGDGSTARGTRASRAAGLLSCPMTTSGGSASAAPSRVAGGGARRRRSGSSAGRQAPGPRGRACLRHKRGGLARPIPFR